MKKLVLLTGILFSCLIFGKESNSNNFSKIELTKQGIIQSKEFQEFLIENWYWFTLCGNTFAMITDTEEEAFEQALEYYMTSSNCARERGEFSPYYV